MPIDELKPVAWRVKDYADGWILCHYEKPARKLANDMGALFQPLYVHPTPITADIENEFFYDPRTGRVAGEPAAADTPYDPTTQPYDEPFRHVAADTGPAFPHGISKETQDALDAIDANIRNAAINAKNILVGAADTGGLVERLTLNLSQISRERDELLRLTTVIAAMKLQAELAAACGRIAELELLNASKMVLYRDEQTIATLVAACEQIAALKQEVQRLQSKLNEAFDYDARDGAK